MKKKLIKALVICLVVAAVGFGGAFGYNSYFVKKPVVAASQYYAVSARKMNLQVSVQGTGTAYAAVTKEVLPNNNGTLKDLELKVGDTVTSGQKLFVSDSDDLRKSVTTAQNSLTKQNLSLSSDQDAAKIDENKIAMDQLAVNESYNQLSDAKKQLNKMTVNSPIGGVVTAVNNSNGDNMQSSKSVLTIVDMNSIKIKVSVDELDIEKIKIGQKSDIKFDAIKDKTFEGSVETISPVGTTSNNVTTYEVVVAVKDPAGIKLGMNGNVTIQVENKENALSIPAEALVENNGQKYVRVESTESNNEANKEQTNSTNSQTQQTNEQNNQNNQGNGQTVSGKNNRQSGNGSSYRGAVISGSGKLIPVKTGLETQNYIEITEGLTEGQKVLVQLPQTTTTTTNNNKNAFGNGMGGNFGGNMSGGNIGSRSQGGSSAPKN